MPFVDPAKSVHADIPTTHTGVTYIYVCMYICVYVSLYVYMHTHVDTDVHTDVWVHTPPRWGDRGEKEGKGKEDKPKKG